MKLLPEYAQNIVVAVVHQGRWRWLVTEKEDWFLDRPKWARAFADAGLAADGDDDERCGISVLDETTITEYLEAMREHVASIQDLSALVNLSQPLEDLDAILEVMPALLVDFDRKRLINSFPEPSGRFEEFVPAGWIGEYGSFLDQVPDEQTYWKVKR